MIPLPLLRVLSLSSCLLAAACGSLPNHTADFATNPVLYVDVPFTTQAPGDRDVFVAPIQDARDEAALPQHERGFPIVYGADGFWERPVREMLADVLVRQIADSKLFGRVVDQPAPTTLLIRPTLQNFTTGTREAMAGRRSFAEVSLRLEVLGPARADGGRDVLLDRVYGSRQVSELELNPPSPYRLIGRALQQSMQQLLAGLDGHNLGRSAVPLAVPAAAAAAPAR
ncbi:MAG: hypothetical protein JNL08_20715 [Planctomycetes bacterium]|nr:hypothetical protein [Planctomycetota bacterium]